MEELRKTLTLYELNALVRQTLESGMPDDYWVEAELSEVHEVRGHCYMELIQKDSNSNTPVAKASAKCWASTWNLVKPHFERVTHQQLHAGMKVLLKVFAQFHENYGFSWIVSDIDPTYTLGDMARKRQEIIQQLKAEGVFELQRELRLPIFCQRIAVISAEKAAGYGDFRRQLADNEYGFHFDVTLFPAIMQGEQVEQSIIAALEKIWNTSEAQPCFDAVVIIRGGGALADLSGFDTLALAENVAQFPLPIITGIGHDRDETILDMVSHTRVKTPTAAAAFLISNLKQVLDAINDAQVRITRYAQQKIKQEVEIDALYGRIIAAISQRVVALQGKVEAIEAKMPIIIDRKLQLERHRLQLIEEKTKSLDPAILLKRGYSITLKDGHTVRDASTLSPGDEIETRFANGSVKSTVNP